MSEMLLKEMEEVSLSQSKEEEQDSRRSFLLIDENETLQVNTLMCREVGAVLLASELADITHGNKLCITLTVLLSNHKILVNQPV